jgi:hypothetical protein
VADLLCLVTYIDNSRIDIQYSLAALLVRISPTHGKGLPVNESKDFWDGIKRNEEVDVFKG